MTVAEHTRICSPYPYAGMNKVFTTRFVLCAVMHFYLFRAARASDDDIVREGNARNCLRSNNTMWSKTRGLLIDAFVQ